MFLMRLGAPGAEKPVVRIDDKHYVDVSDIASDFAEKFFGTGALNKLAEQVEERVAAGNVSTFDGERIGSPIARPHQILCIGLNYSDHAADGSDGPFRTHPVYKVSQHACRPQRRRSHTARFHQARLGSGTGNCDRQAHQLPQLPRGSQRGHRRLRCGQRR